MSRTNPDADYMYRDQKPEGFFWLAHRTVDAKHNFIVDVHVTPGNVSDSTVYLDRLDHVLERFRFPLEAVALDAGYFTTGIAKALVERCVFGVIARRRFGGKKGMFRKTRYTYLPEEDVYLCPARQQTVERSFADGKELHGLPWAPLHLLQGDREGTARQSGSSHRTKHEEAGQPVGQKGPTT